MTKHIVEIELVTTKQICLEADNPNDIFCWESLDAFTRLPQTTIETLRKIACQNEGYLRITEIKPASEAVKHSVKEPVLPKIKPFSQSRFYKNPEYAIFLPDIGETFYTNEVINMYDEDQSVVLKRRESVSLSRNDYAIFSSFIRRVGLEGEGEMQYE